MKPDNLNRAKELSTQLTNALRAAYQDAVGHGTQVEVLATYRLIDPSATLERHITELRSAIVADQEEVAPDGNSANGKTAAS